MYPTFNSLERSFAVIDRKHPVVTIFPPPLPDRQYSDDPHLRWALTQAGEVGASSCCWWRPREIKTDVASRGVDILCNVFRWIWRISHHVDKVSILSAFTAAVWQSNAFKAAKSGSEDYNNVTFTRGLEYHAALRTHFRARHLVSFPHTSYHQVWMFTATSNTN